MATPDRHIERWSTAHAGIMVLGLAASVYLDQPAPIVATGLCSITALLVVGGYSVSIAHVASWANALTGARLIGASVLGVAATAPRVETHGTVFAAAGLALIALDGLDGYLARRLDRTSSLGARFDGAVDAYLTLILAAAAFFADRTGAWILVAGLLRYGYVLIAPLIRRPGAELRRSGRARVVFVIAFCSLLTPFLPAPGLYGPAAAIGTGLLTGSFLIDGWRISRGPERWTRLAERIRALIR